MPRTVSGPVIPFTPLFFAPNECQANANADTRPTFCISALLIPRGASKSEKMNPKNISSPRIRAFFRLRSFDNQPTITTSPKLRAKAVQFTYP